jgi:hypothetical protein
MTVNWQSRGHRFDTDELPNEKQGLGLTGLSPFLLAVLNHHNELQKKLIDIRDEKHLFVNDDNLDIQGKYILRQIDIIEKI